MRNNPTTALHAILNQMQGIHKQDLTVLEHNILKICLEALGWEAEYNDVGEITAFKNKEK